MAKRTATGADGRRYVEDGSGGWREMGPEHITGAMVDLPPDLARNVVEGQIRAGNPEFVSNEAGTDWGTRFVMKNFATSPESAKAYLQSLGYEVRQYQPAGVLGSVTDPFPFWVRKGPTDSWRPVDPPSGTGGVMEFIRDALDLTTDAVQGALQSAAGVGAGVATANPLIGMGAALGVGTATDYMKGNAGAMLGIPQQPSVSGSVQNAIPGAIMSGMPVPPVAGKVFGGVVPKAAPGPVSNAMVQLMAKTAGTTPELLRARAAIPGYGMLASTESALLKIRSLFQRYDDGVERLPMRIEADEIIQKAKANGVGIDARPLLSRMDDFTLKAVPVEKETARTVKLATEETYKKATQEVGAGTKAGSKLSKGQKINYLPTESGIPREPVPFHNEVRGTVADRATIKKSAEGAAQAESIKTTVKTEMADVMKPRTEEGAAAHAIDKELPATMSAARLRFQNWIEAAGHNEADVPPDFYESMKRSLQDIAAGKGEYANNKVSSVTADAFGKVAKHARRTLEDAMDATGIRSSVTLKPYSHVMTDLDKTVGNIAKLRDGYYRGKTAARQIKSAEGQIKMLHGDLAGLENLKMMRDVDRSLGTDLDAQFKRAGVIHLKPEQMLGDTAAEASLGTKFTESFGKQGKPNIVPRFSPQGKPINPIYSTTAALGAGAMAGHPLAVGAGLALASPRAQLFALKAAHKVGEAMPEFVNVMGRAATSPTGKAALATTLKSIQAGQ